MLSSSIAPAQGTRRERLFGCTLPLAVIMPLESAHDSIVVVYPQWIQSNWERKEESAMNSQPVRAQEAPSPAEIEVRALYRQLLDEWNKPSAGGFAALFTHDGSTVGFDGSMLDGSAEIESVLSQIFANHQTAPYVAKVRSVRFLAPTVAILRAVAGMVPPGQSDLNPAVNAIQTLVAAKDADHWRIVLFQNTPAAFHGRPEASEQLTEELRQLLE